MWSSGWDRHATTLIAWPLQWPRCSSETDEKGIESPSEQSRPSTHDGCCASWRHQISPSRRSLPGILDVRPNVNLRRLQLPVCLIQFLNPFEFLASIIRSGAIPFSAGPYTSLAAHSGRHGSAGLGFGVARLRFEFRGQR